MHRLGRNGDRIRIKGPIGVSKGPIGVSKGRPIGVGKGPIGVGKGTIGGWLLAAAE